MNNLQKNIKKPDNKGRSARMNKTVVLLVLFCLCIGGISMVSAKYMKQNATKNNSATAKEFYFTSDLLDGKVHEVVPTEDSESGKTASITIRLKNHIDDLRYSETEIQYTMSVKDANGKDVTNVSIQEASGTIPAGKTENNKDITISNLAPGTYTVTATTDNIYRKTLTGTIKVAEPDTKVYASLHDETQYIEVTVWTTDYSGEVSLKYGNIGLLPDNTDKVMATAASDGGTIKESNWEANTSHVFRFFKTNTDKTYQVAVNDKEVTVSEKQ